MANVLQLDDNMVPGQTYTYQFKCANFFCVSDLSAAFQNDITQFGPPFIGSLQVTSPSTTDLYNVQFTYQGDGSDVVSDTANELVQAASQGSNNSFTFVGAIGAAASAIAVTLGGAAQQIGSTIANGVQTGVGAVTSGAAKGVQNILTPVEIALVIVAALLAILIFTAGKSGGIRTPTFAVGG